MPSAQQDAARQGFARQDVGLGTAYERFVTYRLIRTWLGSRGIRSAMEGPVEGFAGMPGLHLIPLARQGIRVTVVHPHPAALQQVRRIYQRCGLTNRLETVLGGAPGGQHIADAVLSFNALPLLADWRAYVQTLMASCRHYALFVVTNPDSYGVGLRRLLRSLELKAPGFELFEHEAARPDVLHKELSRAGRILESTFVDCPWWPDLFGPAGHTLIGETLGRLVGRARAVSGHAGARLVSAAARVAHETSYRFVHDEDSFPFCSDGAPRTLIAALRRHPVFDRSHRQLGRLFGHHRAYLVEVTGARREPVKRT
jgi:hypothetical protein